MENIKKSYPSLPSNYITIVDLQNRWLKQKQQQQQQDDDNHQKKQEEKQQTTDNLTKNDTHNSESVKAKSYSPFHKPIPPSISLKNPNFSTRNGHFHRNKLVKESRAVEKASNSQINVATEKVESNHILSNFNEDGDGEKDKKNSQLGNKRDDFSSMKLVKEFGEVKQASNSTPEAPQISVETAKEESNKQILRNNKDEGGENAKRNSQFRNRNVNEFGKKRGKEFRVVKKASNSSSESSQLNVETAKVESNHILSNKEDEIGENVMKNSRFRKNPNFKNKRENYRNFNGEKRLKEVKSNVDVAIVGNDDRKVEDDDEMKTKKKKKKKKNKSKNRNKKKSDQIIVDDQAVEKKDDHDEGDDLTVVKRDNDHEGDDPTVEKKDDDDERNDQTVEKKDIDDEGEDQTVVRKCNDDEGEDGTVEKKDKGENQTVEIEGKMKEVNVSENSERSTAVIKEGRRVYGAYRRVDHRGLRREMGISDGRSTAVIQGGRQVCRKYSGVELKGSFHRRNTFRGEENVVDQNYGRSTAVIEGWRGGNRRCSGGENRGKLMWVKKNEEHS